MGSVADPKPRCFILELPAEVRVMIYEELTRLHSPRDIFLSIRETHGDSNTKTANFTAIARVNHQIRQEAIPTLYRRLEVEVEVATKDDQRAVYSWLSNVSPAVLQAVYRITFYSRTYCECRNVIFLDDLKESAVAFECGSSRDGRGDNMETYNLDAKGIVEELQIFRGERWILTKNAMEALLDLFCGMVAEQAVAEQRWRKKKRF